MIHIYSGARCVMIASDDADPRCPLGVMALHDGTPIEWPCSWCPHNMLDAHALESIESVNSTKDAQPQSKAMASKWPSLHHSTPLLRRCLWCCQCSCCVPSAAASRCLLLRDKWQLGLPRGTLLHLLPHRHQAVHPQVSSRLAGGDGGLHRLGSCCCLCLKQLVL